MIGYYAAYILVVLCIIIALFKNEKLFNKVYLFISIGLVCLCGFRHAWKNAYGNDTYPYYMYFLKGDNAGFYDSNEMEPVLTIINKVLRLFIDNMYLYGFIIACLSIIPILFLYKKISPLPIVAVFIYTCVQLSGSSPYFMSFNQMRQSLALGFIAISIYFYIKYNYKLNKRCFIWMIIGIFTHYSSALICLPILFRRFQLPKSIFIIIIIVSSFSGFFLQSYSDQYVLFIISIGKSDFSNYGEFNFISQIPFLLLTIAVFLISSKKECNSFEYKCLFLTSVLLCLFSGFQGFVFRYVAYYNVFGSLAIASSFYNNFKKKKTRLVIIPMAIVTFAYYSYTLLSSLPALEKAFPYSVW